MKSLAYMNCHGSADFGTLKSQTLLDCQNGTSERKKCFPFSQPSEIAYTVINCYGLVSAYSFNSV